MPKRIFLLIALAVLASAAYSQEVNNDTGEIFADEATISAARHPGDTTCFLLVPAVVQNRESFQVRVSYDPPTPPGARRERFVFRWPQREDCVEFLKERTERTKFFINTLGGVIGSLETVATPSALCVEGTFEAEVIVTGVVDCRAKATMTVVNP